jgi:PQQ-like domain
MVMVDRILLLPCEPKRFPRLCVTKLSSSNFPCLVTSTTIVPIRWTVPERFRPCAGGARTAIAMPHVWSPGNVTCALASSFQPSLKLRFRAFPAEPKQKRICHGGSLKFEAVFPSANLFYDDMVIAVGKLFTMGTILSSPVVVGNTVYVGSTDGNLYALQ